MTREYIVEVTNDVVINAFDRFENDWSPERLIRCRNCKYSLKWPWYRDSEELPLLCTITESERRPDWFCADGEEKESLED